jgi:hypothetical protein
LDTQRTELQSAGNFQIHRGRRYRLATKLHADGVHLHVDEKVEKSVLPETPHHDSFPGHRGSVPRPMSRPSFCGPKINPDPNSVEGSCGRPFRCLPHIAEVAR